MEAGILLAVRLAGVPSPWSGSGEKTWKETLRRGIPEPTTEYDAQGVLLHFRLTGADSGYSAADLDNLCEPIFQVLIGEQGWFSGKRANLRWFRASKSYGEAPGCDLTVTRSSPVDAPQTHSRMLLSTLYIGPLPLRGSDSPLADWVGSIPEAPVQIDRCAVLLQFADTAVNIGDIPTGRVKNVVDCLYPVLGGKPSDPEDWRVDILQVEKGAAYVSLGALRITLYAMS